MQTKILLVEDDETASQLIHDYLIDSGFSVKPVFTATDSVSYLTQEEFDIVLLDINLPDFNGFEVLKSIRKHTSVPVIVTSAYSETQSKLTAFKYGANDYMVKPIDLEELEARIWVQLKQHSKILKSPEEEKLFELREGAIWFKGKRLELTTIEHEILAHLVEQQNRVVPREELIEKLTTVSSGRSLDNHIKNIRKKLGDNGSKSTYLKTVYGVGYMLKG